MKHTKKKYKKKKYVCKIHRTVLEYLLLTEFEFRTVKLRTEFSPLRFIAQAQSARAINRRKKKRIRNLQNGPRRRG